MQVRQEVAPDGTQQQWFLLGAALVWCVIWGLWAILQDHRTVGNESLLPHAFHLTKALGQGDMKALGTLFHSLGFRPPLPVMVQTGFAWLMPGGVTLVSMRLTCLALHLLAVVQVFGLTRLLAGTGRAASISALLAAAAPMIAGWFRVETPEPLTAVVYLAVLHQLLRTDLKQPRPAALLGILIGLGLLTKLLFPALMLGPLLAFILLRIRGLRSLLHAGLCALLTFACAGWWYLAKVETILANFLMSISGGQVNSFAGRDGLKISAVDQLPRIGNRLIRYFGDAPEHLALVTLAAAALLLCWRRRLVPRETTILLGAAFVGGYAPLLLLFDAEYRYMLPLLLLCCALAGLTISHLSSRLSPAMRPASLLVTAGLLAGLHIHGLFQLPRSWWLPEESRGLFQPKTEIAMCYTDARRWVIDHPGPALLLSTDRGAQEWFFHRMLEYITEHNLTPHDNYFCEDRYHPTGDCRAWEEGYKNSKSIHVLVAFSENSTEPRYESWDKDPAEEYIWRWFKRQRRTLVARQIDESEYKIDLYRVTPGQP